MTVLLKLGGVAGAAFLLRTRAQRTITLQHADGIVDIRKGAAYATVQLPTTPPTDELRGETWRILQEALDIRAATHRDALATHRGEREYMLWARAGNGYDLTIADTMIETWEANFQGAVATAGRVAPTGAPTALPYHPSFRFYRLSLLSDDLFDAYRNAHLAFECLVSNASPKGSETERNWLKRVLGGPLATAVPGGMDINATVDNVYDVRLFLFHAKTGQTFYPPQGRERERIQAVFQDLTALLVSLIRHQFGNQFSGGWGQFSQKGIDKRARVSFQFDEVVYKTQDLEESATPKVHINDAFRRFGNLWAMLEVAPPAALTSITGTTLRLDGQDVVWITLPQPVSMENVTAVKIEVNYLDYHLRAPQPAHGM